MSISGRFKSQRGATRLGVMDILAALILLGVLVFAAYLEFPNYQRFGALARAFPGAARGTKIARRAIGYRRTPRPLSGVDRSRTFAACRTRADRARDGAG
jgi:hypothetical protein